MSFYEPKESSYTSLFERNKLRGKFLMTYPLVDNLLKKV